MPVHAGHGASIPSSHFGAAARSRRPSRSRTHALIGRPFATGDGGKLSRREAPGREGAPRAGAALSPRSGEAECRHDAPPDRTLLRARAERRGYSETSRRSSRSVSARFPPDSESLTNDRRSRRNRDDRAAASSGSCGLSCERRKRQWMMDQTSTPARTATVTSFTT